MKYIIYTGKCNQKEIVAIIRGRLNLIVKKTIWQMFDWHFKNKENKDNCNFNDVPDLDIQLYIKYANSAVTMIQIQYRFI